MDCNQTYIGTVERYDTDLRQIPLPLEAGCVSGSIQMQFLNDPFHLSKVETFAIIKILIESLAE
jgi:hypothetical protein